VPDSKAQVRWAHATVQGSTGGDKTFAKEVISQMHGRKMNELPERSRAHFPRPKRRKQ
jgi:hypothetical protein